jgi:hypothetical protein
MRLFYLLIFLFPLLVQGDYVETVVMCQLGNQFCMVAAGTSLALDNNAKAIFPAFSTETKWDMPINYQEVFFRIDAPKPRKTLHRWKYTYWGLAYKPIPYTPNMKLKGLFLSEKYFLNNKEHILALFAPSDKIKIIYMENIHR